MSKEKFGLRKSKPILPSIDLLVAPHQDQKIFVNFPPFGPDSFKNNLREIRREYSNPELEKGFSFREPTTAESISAIHFSLKSKLYSSLPPQGFHIGWAIETNEGFYINPPRKANSRIISDENILAHYRDNMMKKSRGLYFLPNGDIKGVKDFCFIEGNITRKTRKISQDNIARALQFSMNGNAGKIKEIASLIKAKDLDCHKNMDTRFCPASGSIDLDFETPCLRAIILNSYNYRKERLLGIYFEELEDSKENLRYAFGVYEPLKD